MKTYAHPALAAVPLTTVMQALADPCRLSIVRTLLAAAGRELACGEFGLRVAKATGSHHFDVLRQAGLVASRVDGTRCMTSLRQAELEARFPGLLALVSGAEGGAEPGPAAVPAPTPRTGPARRPRAARTPSSGPAKVGGQAKAGGRAPAAPSRRRG